MDFYYLQVHGNTNAVRWGHRYLWLGLICVKLQHIYSLVSFKEQFSILVTMPSGSR